MEQIQTIKQSDYDRLLEERTAYQQSGMDAKVAEWDFKIKSLEASAKYVKLSFQDIAEKFGIKGLNEALSRRGRELEEKAKDLCGDLLKKKRISESAMYGFIDAVSFRIADDNELKAKVIELLSPKLSGTAEKLFRAMFALKSVEVDQGNKVAFIRIEKVEDYKQNDNPPFEELLKVVDAKVSNFFHTLYIAFPMIGYEKQIDPVIFGTLRNPSASYNELEEGWNNELTIDRLDWLNIGNMYSIAEW